MPGVAFTRLYVVIGNKLLSSSFRSPILKLHSSQRQYASLPVYKYGVRDTSTVNIPLVVLRNVFWKMLHWQSDGLTNPN